MPEMRYPEGRERLDMPIAIEFEAGSLPVSIRNGLPEFRPYVYRGQGYDIFATENEEDDEW